VVALVKRLSTGVGVMSSSAHMLALLVAISGLAAGCIPVIRTSVIRYGVEAKLVDAKTAEPIAKQTEVESGRGRPHSKTCRTRDALWKTRSVLECGCLPPLSSSRS
jgi:hypothetical protein